jgi:hypothetical protein
LKIGLPGNDSSVQPRRLSWLLELEGCRAIEIRAGAKKEQGPDLRVVSDSGEEVLVEVTARRPSKQLESLELPTTLDRFLEETLKIDMERLQSKLDEQERQVRRASCIVVAGWHAALGLAPLEHFAGLKTVQRIRELRGLCIYSSWTGEEGTKEALLCLPSPETKEAPM